MFFLAPSIEANRLFDAALAAHSKLSRFRVHIVFDGQVGGARQQSTYDLEVDPANVLVRVQRPRRSGEDKSDRTYFFSGGKMVAYDVFANERLARDLPAGESRLDQMLFVFGTLPDLVQGLLKPSEMKAFLDQTRKVPGWSLTHKHGMDLLIRPQPGVKKLDVLGFDPASHLLRRVDVGVTESGVRWTFDYSPPRKIAFRPKPSARLVTSFTVAPEPPTYATEEAEHVTKTMLNAEARLTAGAIGIDSSEGHTRISLAGKRVREDGPHLSYAFDGKVLTVLDRDKGHFYRGTAIRSTIPDLIVQLGLGVDPILRQILQHRIPFREAIRSNMKVSLQGRMTMPDGPCDILSLDGGRTKVTMFVRRRDHYVAGMMTQISDNSGRIIATSNRRFRYQNVGIASPADNFTLSPKPGQEVLPLPELKISQ